MAEQGKQKKWKRFQPVKFDRKRALKRIQKAERATSRHAHRFILKRWRNVREVRRLVSVWALAAGVLILATGLQLVWNRAEYQTLAGAPGGTYAEAVLGPVDTLNPLFAVTSAERAASYLVFSRLMNYDSTGNVNYDLAQSVDVSEDGDTYTITIRDDATWHDGRQLTADDIAFTAELLQDSSSRTQFRGWDSIATEVVSDYEIQFELESPYAGFENALMFPVLPQHILRDVNPSDLREHDFSGEPIGSGAFEFRNNQLTDATGSSRIVHLAANEGYYRGSPKLDRLQLHVYPDREQIKRALTVNEVNAAAGLTGAEVNNLDLDRYETKSEPIQTGVYALLNTTSQHLSDANVRRALQLATDTSAIRERIRGDVPRLDLPFTSGQVDAEMPRAPETDIERAESILDEAGWERDDDGNRVDDDGNVLQLNIVTTNSGEYERALETLMGQWRRLGIQINERIVDSSDPTQSFTQTVLQPRNYDVLVYQLEVGRDPDVYAYWHSSQATSQGLNLSNYSSTVSDDILATGRTTLDRELRSAKYVDFANRWLRDVPAIGLYQQVSHYVHSGSSRGVLDDIQLVSPVDRYTNVHLWTVEETPVYKTP